MPRAKSAVVIGNPNSGKSTLFNHLTGLNQKTANYPGVTVERRSGTVFFNNKKMDLIDLPGCYSIYPFSEDERISIDVIKGNLASLTSPDKIIYVLDATQIYQGLTFLQQLSELNIPVVVALTMNDIATKKGIKINPSLLSNKLKLPVIPINAKTEVALIISLRLFSQSKHLLNPFFLLIKVQIMPKNLVNDLHITKIYLKN